MLKIRLQRTGRTNIPEFRLIITECQNAAKTGRVLELLGSFRPGKRGLKNFNKDRIKHWLSLGAQTSGTIHNYLIDEKIISGKKRSVTRIPKRKGANTISKAEEKTSAPETPAEKIPEEKKEEALKS